MTSAGAGGPLAGIRVIESASYVAVPLAAMQLALLGAEVIRVDRPGGGPDYRRWPLAADGTSIYWAGLNKAKRSIELDLRSATGRDALGHLVASGGAGGGIFLTNAAASTGTDYDELRAYRPDLILLRLRGTTDGRPAVDYTVGAGSGIPLITGAPGESAPVNHQLPAYDLICGLNAALAVVAAVRHRERTGQGQLIELSLEGVATAMISHLGLYTEAAQGHGRERIGNSVYGSFGADFETADQARVMIVALTRAQWLELVAVTETGPALARLALELGADFSDEPQRYQHRRSITAALEPWFRARTLPDVAAAFSRAALPWSPYRTLTEAITGENREHLLAGPVFDELDQPGVGNVVAARFAATMSATPPPAPSAAPTLGQHTAELLAELGLDG